MANVHLLVIDPQIDFCDPAGKLSVANADKDMERLAKLVVKGKKKFSDISVTLDSHRVVHIAHPIWWVDESGNHPAPFTLITKDEVCGKNPKWRSYNPGFQKRSEEYVTKLAENGRYVLVIWPPHCLIGTPGHAIYPSLLNALHEYEGQFALVNYVTKGSNIFTEHYSAVQADVPDPKDPVLTGLNTRLIKQLETADVIAIAGEALSHCVANTVRDIATAFGDDKIKKFTLLVDCCSNVTGFEKMGKDFVDELVSRGMQVCKSTELF